MALVPHNNSLKKEIIEKSLDTHHSLQWKECSSKLSTWVLVNQRSISNVPDNNICLVH